MAGGSNSIHSRLKTFAGIRTANFVTMRGRFFLTSGIVR